MDLTGEVRPCLTYFERGSPKTRKIQNYAGVNTRRFRLVQSLSQRMLTHPDAEPETLTQTIRTIRVGYGLRMSQRVHAALTVWPDWQEQPVDLSATLFPVIHALAAVGISSYLGGSIASSIHGMQQSASDIDLVLLPQGHETLPVGPALASLQDDYLVEPEVVAQGLRETLPNRIGLARPVSFHSAGPVRDPPPQVAKDGRIP